MLLHNIILFYYKKYHTSRHLKIFLAENFGQKDDSRKLKVNLW